MKKFRFKKVYEFKKFTITFSPIRRNTLNEKGKKKIDACALGFTYFSMFSHDSSFHLMIGFLVGMIIIDYNPKGWKK